MKWPFTKPAPVKPNPKTPQEKKANIEIVAHKRASRNQIRATKKVSQDLNKLLSENGFTLKIVLASRQNPTSK